VSDIGVGSGIGTNGDPKSIRILVYTKFKRWEKNSPIIHTQYDNNTIAIKPEESYKSDRTNQDKGYRIGKSRMECGIQLNQGT
jgi:hypothetical protein